MVQKRHKSSLVLALVLVGIVAKAQAGSSLMDKAGNLRLSSVKDASDAGVVAFVTSPGASSGLKIKESSDALSYEKGKPSKLTCRGATMSDSGDTTALGTACVVAGSIVLDGISVGDMEAGLRDSRHGRTLAAIFRARLSPGETQDDSTSLVSKQTLVLPVMADAVAAEKVVREVASLFASAAAECGSSSSFSDLYDVKVLPYSDPSMVLSLASEEALSNQIKGSLSAALTLAHAKAKASLSADKDGSSVESLGLVTVSNAYNKQSRTVRAKLAAWKARVARGLLVDGFGSEAESMIQRVLKTFDAETVGASGLPHVASSRRELRSNLQALLETGIQEIFEGQIENLESTTLKRLNAQLLKTVNEPVESVMDSNAAILRNEAFAFEAAADNLEVPSMGLTKTKVVRDMTGKLNDALMSFPDSPAAKVKRMGAAKAVARKEKKPGQRAIDLGLDLVAVLRPDGFGSFQGYAGYQLAGSSLTFGVHNDADDPQTIAQFGGVRPPLLRVQPKLRVDVEL